MICKNKHVVYNVFKCISTMLNLFLLGRFSSSNERLHLEGSKVHHVQSIRIIHERLIPSKSRLTPFLIMIQYGG